MCKGNFSSLQDSTATVFDSLVGEAHVYGPATDPWPLHAPEQPVVPFSPSERVAGRRRRKQHVWREATKTLRSVNALYAGNEAGETVGSLTTAKFRATEEFFDRVYERENALGRESGKLLGTTTRGSKEQAARVLKELVGEGAESYSKLEKRTAPVFLTKGMVGRVAEPDDAACVDMMDALPPDVRSLFLPDATGRPSCLLPEPHGNNLQNLRKVDNKWKWNGGSRAAVAGYLRSVRDRNFWAFLPPSESKATCAMFFLPKKNPENLRKILACVPANERMVPSPSVDLPGPWQGARVRIKGKRFWVGDIDVQSFFTRIKIPLWLAAYFCLLPVPAHMIMTEAEAADGRLVCPLTGNIFGENELVCPAYARVPMGWSLAVHVTVSIINRELSKFSYINLNRPSAETYDLAVEKEEVAAGAFIDNVYALGAEQERVDAFLDEAREHLNSIGLKIGDRHEAVRVLKEVGMVFDGNENTLHHPTARSAALRVATEYVCSKPRVRGDTLRCLVGHFTWAFGCNRSLFAIFGAVYKFLETTGDGWCRWWHTAREEMRLAARLLIFAETDLGRKVCDAALCTDAEGPNASDAGGGATVVTYISPSDAKTLLTTPDAADNPGTENGPSALWAAKQDWTTTEQTRWRFREHINRLELRSLLSAVSRVGRTGSAQGSVFLALTDSSAVLGAVRKGRSSSWALRRLLSRLTAVQLLYDTRVHLKWVPSGVCPADEPSRERFGGYSKTIWSTGKQPRQA